MHQGVVVGLYAKDPDFDYGANLDEVRDTGATSVLFLVQVPQQNVTSPGPVRLTPEERATLAQVLRLAKARGLRSGVIPILALAELERGKWRGTIAPPSWSTWFELYRSALLEVARIAAEEGAELLVVGSELCSSESQEAEWSRTIADVRRVFPGRVTYSANWDHLPRERWVEGLDLLGLNAYYELVCADQRSDLDVWESSWRAVAAETIEPWRRRFGKKLLFTEVGYPSSAGADRYPWDYTADGTVDTSIQERLYVAFLRQWGNAPDVEGAFFYVWWEGPERDERGYTPRGKPAGELLRSVYASRSDAR